MAKTYTYLKQGDGKDSWICEDRDEKGLLIDRYMVYENPNEPTVNIDIAALSDEQILLLKQRFDALTK